MNQAIHNTQYDIYLVGVGGQGVLTLSDLITQAAFQEEVPANLYPTKGMAQRGGFVKVQVRLGHRPVGADAPTERELIGPNIPEGSADLVIAMEVSEALKAVRFIKPGGDFVLFGHVWQPTAVMLGKADYPTLDRVLEQVQSAGGKVHYIDPESLPLYEGAPVAANIYVLGTAIGHTGLGKVLDPSQVARTVQNRWKKAAGRNGFAFQAGLETE